MPTTGVLNWAPPKARVVLRNVPNDPGRLVSSDGWCSLARLEGELGVAAGVGGNGEFNLSLSEGRLLLRIKAALVAGAGMKGSLTFQVGYEAIGELLNLVRRYTQPDSGLLTETGDLSLQRPDHIRRRLQRRPNGV